MTLYQLDHNDELYRNEYFRVHLLIAKILRKDLESQERAMLIEQDWIRDSKGEKRITKDRIFECLYEMADIWTPDISAKQ